MVILNFRRTSAPRFLTLWSMRSRNSVRKRWAAAAFAIAACGAVPAGSVWADEPVDEPTPTVPDEDAPEQPADDAPETGEVDGAAVAVAAPPVPPVVDEPEVAGGAPPVPPVAAPQTAAPQVAVAAPPVPPAALIEQAEAALDLLGNLF